MREARAPEASPPTDRDEPDAPALVHDYLLVMRGAERTFAAIAGCWPEATIYTLLYDPEGTQGRFAGRSVRSSYLQRLGVGQTGFRALLPLFPRAAERLPLQRNKLVISSSSAFAHGIRAADDAIHVSYCHSPFRYAWHERQRGLEGTPRGLRPVVGAMLDRSRHWDVAASRRVSHYIANSELTKLRIEEFWGREASVVHPPVEVERFSIGTPEDFFLVVTELVPHKRVEHALEAARRARAPIKVVGTGPDMRRLQSLYGDTAQFVGRISDEQLADLYPRARTHSSQHRGVRHCGSRRASRRSARRRGGWGRGARDCRRGQDRSARGAGRRRALAESLAQTDFDRLSPVAIRAHATQFSTSAFQRKLVAKVQRVTSGSTNG